MFLRTWPRLGSIDLPLANLWLCFFNLNKGKNIVVATGISHDVLPVGCLEPISALSFVRSPIGRKSPLVSEYDAAGALST